MSFQSNANAPITSTGTVPPPSAIGISGILPGQSAVNTTRILSLTGFSKELKTRDIQNIFVDFEDDRGGYRIKWLDDTGCLIVFSDPLTAKRAFLQLLASPHPHLIPSTTAEGEAVVPLLRPYVSTTEEVSSVISSVANRPRSRSIASNNNVNSSPSASGIVTGSHGRRMSSSHARGGSMAGSQQNGAGQQQGNNERRPFGGRPSFGQGQMQAIMDEANQASAASSSESALDARSPSPKTTLTGGEGNTSGGGGGAIDWSSVSQGGGGGGRPRAASGQQGQTFSPPVSPERGMRAGATSPSSLRRLIQQRG